MKYFDSDHRELLKKVVNCWDSNIKLGEFRILIKEIKECLAKSEPDNMLTQAIENGLDYERFMSHINKIEEAIENTKKPKKQPLTENEILKLKGSGYLKWSDVEFARAIEKHHDIK